MRTSFFIGILIVGLGLGNVFSQTGLQVGFNYSMGRSYTEIDFSQANANNLTSPAAIAVPLGFEIAWLPRPHWRISTGLSFTFYDTRILHENPDQIWSGFITDNFTYSSLPLEVSYRLSDGPEMKKSFIFILGGTYDIWGMTSGTSGRSSGWVRDGVEIGSTQFLNFQTTSESSFSLRFGLGQEWRLGKRNRSFLQAFVMYNLGLTPIWEGDFSYWNENIPDGYRWDTPINDVMGEPVERYEAITSNGSYLTVGVKFYYDITK